MQASTPHCTLDQALDGAIEMLRAITAGKSFPALDFHERLQRYEEARDAHRRQELADAARRDEIRKMADLRRAS
jgi:hypothetical protein